jgi:diguanylate cyclase (GGDEF)-like protein
MSDRDQRGASPLPVTASLGPEELTFFLMRHRRGETLERFEPRLDNFLREILAKANDFVHSEAGAILLDDPRTKIMRSAPRELTVVTGFGQLATQLLGRRFSVSGIIGQVYTSGVRVGCYANKKGPALQEADGELAARSLMGVPVVLGNSICGVLLLINRVGREGYSDEDGNLIQIFASYISSSIQNILDGLRAKELARRDDLTGLFNDRYFHFRLREEITRSEAEHHDLALLFVDLDHFKDVNDSFGHLEGSRVLHEVGLLIGSRSPANAVVARYGGDEFVVILPGMNAIQASAVAQELQDLVAQASLITQQNAQAGRDATGPHPFVTASVGVATLNDHVEPGTTARRANVLIRMADAAMYRAKAEGRNRVVVAGMKTKEYPIASPSGRESQDAPDRGTAEPGRRSHPEPAGDLSGPTGEVWDRPGHRRPR